GADDYLVKPFSARELLARVETHVRMARMRRDAQAALRESEARFRNIADTAPAILWVTEPDGSCPFISGGWYELTGQTEEEGLGKGGFGWLVAVHPEDREQAGRIFLKRTRSKSRSRSIIACVVATANIAGRSTRGAPASGRMASFSVTSARSSTSPTAK